MPSASRCGACGSSLDGGQTQRISVRRVVYVSDQGESAPMGLPSGSAGVPACAAAASCTICRDGAEVVERFRTVAPGEYDAILMDVQMPGMDGYEATRMIRSGANPLGRTIPIIAMTANAFAEDVKKSLDAGMNAHLSKPVDLNALEQTLQRFRYEPSAEQPQ